MIKKYNFKTLAEIIEVVDEKNIDAFLKDFGSWLAITIAMKNPELKGVLEQKSADTFHWIDDGKNDIKINVNITPTQTEKEE